MSEALRGRCIFCEKGDYKLTAVALKLKSLGYSPRRHSQEPFTVLTLDDEVSDTDVPHIEKITKELVAIHGRD